MPYPEGLPEDTYTVSCSGSGGQSFGAFIPKGLTLEAERAIPTTTLAKVFPAAS